MVKLISKREAIRQGLKWFFTGKPCKRGHISVRSINNGGCKACDQEWRNTNSELIHQYNIKYKINNPDYQKNWYENNRESKSLYNKQWYENNKEHCKNREAIYRAQNWYKIKQRRSLWYQNNSTYNSTYYQNNKNKCTNLSKNWRIHNRHLTNIYSKVRRYNIEKAMVGWDNDLIKVVYKKRDELNQLWGTNMVVDHIIPLNPKNRSVRGLHCWHNLQLLEAELNGIKLDKYETDW